MRTDGLYAFDEATRAALPHLVDFDTKMQRAIDEARAAQYRAKQPKWKNIKERNKWIRKQYADPTIDVAEIARAAGISTRQVRLIAGPLRSGPLTPSPQATAAAAEWKRRREAGERVRKSDVAAAYGVTLGSLAGAGFRLWGNAPSL